MAEILESAFSLSLYLITGIVIVLLFAKSGMKDITEKVFKFVFFSLALPALFFVEILNPYYMETSISFFVTVFLLTLIILASSFLSVFILKFTVRKELFNDLAVLMVLPNVFMIPILYIYNEYGSSNSMMSIYSFFSILFLPIYYSVLFLFKRINNPSEVFKRTFSFLFISQLTGFVLLVFSIQNNFPWILYTQIRTLQILVVPIIIFLLGFYFVESMKHLKKTNFLNVGIFILLRQVLIPLFSFILIYLFNIEYKFASVIIILSSCPASPFIDFKEEHSDLKKQIFFYSTVSSLVLIPLAFFFLGLIYWKINRGGNNSPQGVVSL